MKKTLTINLNGLVFHIDEDAYEKLKQYLQAIDLHFSNEEERKEIINDIEARIAELFMENLSSRVEVITSLHVDEVIKIMGVPEDFFIDGENKRNENKSKQKSMYRDPDNRILGGVCSGIGAYFNIDPNIIRVVFILIAIMGAGILAYIILWVVIPEAKTTVQKLNMKGEPINFSTIGKSVKDEFNNVRKKYNI